MTLVNSNDIAKAIGYSVHTVRDMARQKQLPAKRIGRKWLFDLDEIKSFIDKKGAVDRLSI
jgi:excisionase family DNA binding protein